MPSGETVVLDNKIYIIGGDPTLVYDPKTDVWTTLASIPTPRTSPLVAVYQGKIYCISGHVENYNSVIVYRYVNTVEAYDPINDSWSKKVAVPIAVESVIPPIQIGVVDDQLFAIGLNGELYQYSPSADKWSSKASLSVEATYMQVYALNNQLFVITKNGEITEMHMYNPVLNIWTKKANPPLTVYSFVIVVDDKILGGHSQSNPHTNWPELGLSIYDSTTDIWSEANPSPPVRRFHHSQSVGVTSGIYAPKRLYVFGQEQLDLNTFQTFTWAYNPEDNTWSTSKTIPDSYRPSFGHLIAVVEDTFYMGTFYNAQYDPNLGMQYLPIGVQYVPIGYSYHE
jgi:hypothetical protein